MPGVQFEDEMAQSGVGTPGSIRTPGSVKALGVSNTPVHTLTPSGFHSVSEASPSFAGLQSIASTPGLNSSTTLSPTFASGKSLPLAGTLTRTGTASATALLEGEEDPNKEASTLLAYAVQIPPHPALPPMGAGLSVA